MIGLYTEACRRIDTSEVVVSLPASSDDLEVISCELLICEDSKTTGNEFFQLAFGHGLKLVGILADTVCHDCWQACEL